MNHRFQVNRVHGFSTNRRYRHFDSGFAYLFLGPKVETWGRLMCFVFEISRGFSLISEIGLEIGLLGGLFQDTVIMYHLSTTHSDTYWQLRTFRAIAVATIQKTFKLCSFKLNKIYNLPDKKSSLIDLLTILTQLTLWFFILWHSFSGFPSTIKHKKLNTLLTLKQNYNLVNQTAK